MIEILPDREFWRGIYDTQSVVDKDTYLHMYNEVFLQEWNQYVEEKRLPRELVKSKQQDDESESKKDVSFDSLSLSEITEFIRSKKGRKFQRLMVEFDRTRSLIALYGGKFYTYTITNSYADFVSVYLLTKSEITNTINALYPKSHTYRYDLINKYGTNR